MAKDTMFSSVKVFTIQMFSCLERTFLYFTSISHYIYYRLSSRLLSPYWAFYFNFIYTLIFFIAHFVLLFHMDSWWLNVITSLCFVCLFDSLGCTCITVFAQGKLLLKNFFWGTIPSYSPPMQTVVFVRSLKSISLCSDRNYFPLIFVAVFW